MVYPKQLKNIILIQLWFPLIFLIFGIYHGLMQVLYRVGLVNQLSVAGINYYQGLTAHGVINAILLTTFFAVAFGHVIIFQTLKNVHMLLAKLAAVLMLLGASAALWAVFSGNANVLYTFYPPLKAHPLFYLGLAIFIVGSWVGFYSWIKPARDWYKNNPGKKLPLAALGILATFGLWQLCTLPVATEVLVLLVPWSLNWTSSVNVVLARTLFWFFGHPLVYFWLLPTYVMYYNVLPVLVGGKLFSDFAGRAAFLIFLVISTPLGLHHQFSDPGIASQWKAIHTILTSLVALPSMMTAFTLAASMEYAAKKQGGTGLFAWWKKLPYWNEEKWLFPYFFCGLVIFIFGGATGVVNASYNVSLVIHNTSWVPAHFHMTVAGPVFLGILGMTLYLLLGLHNKKLSSPKLALLVPYTWLLGLFFMSSGMFVGGLRGEPRRTNLGLSYLNPASADFRPDWIEPRLFALVGGIIMTLAIIFYFYVLFTSMLSKEKTTQNLEIPLATALHDENIPIVNTWKPWIAAAIILSVIAYTPPIYEILKEKNPGGNSFSPDSPIPLSPQQQ
ncbi:MAG: cbb3-type cytochrome c oxidase subunit I [Bdellovibrio sp.]